MSICLITHHHKQRVDGSVVAKAPAKVKSSKSLTSPLPQLQHRLFNRPSPVLPDKLFATHFVAAVVRVIAPKGTTAVIEDCENCG